MPRNCWIFLAFGVLMSSGCVTGGADNAAPPKARIEAKARAATSETLLLLGSGPFYVVSLATSAQPSDYQAILQVEMTSGGQDFGPQVELDRRTTGESRYTIEPRMAGTADFSALWTPAEAPQASVFYGSVRRGLATAPVPVSRIGGEVVFLVKRVIYAHGFAAGGRTLSGLSYLLFGSEDQLFAVHRKEHPADFDAVASVRMRNGILSDAEAMSARHGALMRVTGQADESAARLVPGGALTEASLKIAKTGVVGPKKRAGAEEVRVEVETLNELYFMEGNAEGAK